MVLGAKVLLRSVKRTVMFDAPATSAPVVAFQSVTCRL